MIAKLKEMKFAIFMFLFSVAFTLGLNVTLAADADLTNAFASGTGYMSDNKSIILVFLAGIFGIYLVIKLGKVGLRKGVTMIISAFKK